MSPNPNRKELRLFVSSTFRDLMPEREQLVKKVFPRIRKECRSRGVEFTEIDLRWGITEEESRSGRTIRICLEEIDRCRPYFIGIIGSRYGWVPGIEEIEKDDEILEEFPWLREFAAQEKSIIEMEFAHGAIHEKNDSAFFYEQSTPQPPPRTEVGEPDSLEYLKRNLQSTGLPYRRFTDPEELGEQVFQDMVAILDRDFPGKRELTPLEHERIEHEAYSLNRRQSYVANPAYYEAFDKFVNGDGPPLILWGKSGLGKSALMAYLAHEYQTQHPDAFVVQHFIGAAEGSDPEDVMRQVMMEIKDRYGLSDVIPSDDQALRDEFPVWLAKVGSNPLLFKEGAGGGLPDAEGQPPPSPRLRKAGEPDRLVLFIDALNQLTGIAPEMHWLPDFIPANIRLILSTTTGLPLEQLRERNWNELELSPLSAEQREAIALGFLQRYRKSLPAEQLHRLSSDKKSESPLFLRTVLEELRIFGHFSTLGEALEDYLSSADERELFQKVLARMEHDHGADAVRDVLTAIWASRHGLSESELMEITGMSRMALSELMIAMEYHLMQREGYYSFFHNYLREAVERRYLPEEAASKAAHARLGEYFSMREYGHRRRDEEPWQWVAAGDLDALWKCFADPEMFMLFAHEDQRYHFIAYLQSFERERNIALFNALYPAMQRDEGYERRRWLAEIAREAAFYDVATEILTTSLAAAQAKGADEESLLPLKCEQARLLMERQEYRLAYPLCSEIAALIEEEKGQSEDLFAALAELSTVMHGLGDYAGAEQVIRRALKFSEVVPPTMRISAIENLAALVSMQGNQDKAAELFEEALELSSKLLGRMHPTTLHIALNLGAALNLANLFDQSLSIFENMLPSIRRSLGDKHLWYLVCLTNLGSALTDIRAYERAERIIIELIEKSTMSQGPENEYTLRSQLGLGYLYYVKGELSKALDIYQTYSPPLAEKIGEDHAYVRQVNETLKRITENLREEAS